MHEVRYSRFCKLQTWKPTLKANADHSLFTRDVEYSNKSWAYSDYHDKITVQLCRPPVSLVISFYDAMLDVARACRSRGSYTERFHLCLPSDKRNRTCRSNCGNLRAHTYLGAQSEGRILDIHEWLDNWRIDWSSLSGSWPGCRVVCLFHRSRHFHRIQTTESASIFWDKASRNRISCLYS